MKHTSFFIWISPAWYANRPTRTFYGFKETPLKYWTLITLHESFSSNDSWRIRSLACFCLDFPNHSFSSDACLQRNQNKWIKNESSSSVLSSNLSSLAASIALIAFCLNFWRSSLQLVVVSYHGYFQESENQPSSSKCILVACRTRIERKPLNSYLNSSDAWSRNLCWKFVLNPY